MNNTDLAKPQSESIKLEAAVYELRLRRGSKKASGKDVRTADHALRRMFVTHSECNRLSSEYSRIDAAAQAAIQRNSIDNAVQRGEITQAEGSTQRLGARSPSGARAGSPRTPARKV